MLSALACRACFLDLLGAGQVHEEQLAEARSGAVDAGALDSEREQQVAAARLCVQLREAHRAVLHALRQPVQHLRFGHHAHLAGRCESVLAPATHPENARKTGEQRLSRVCQSRLLWARASVASPTKVPRGPSCTCRLSRDGHSRSLRGARAGK